jgi:hypothetical protein
MEEEILYYLKLLRFIKSSEFSEEDLDRITEWLLQPRLITPNPTPVIEEYPINVIEEVPNKMMAIALLRDAKHIEPHGNSLIYNKKQYKFNNVYKNEEYENLIAQTVDFTNKRLNTGKDTSLIYYGYSGAGKSTLLDRVLECYTGHRKFKLYEIYLNKLFVYFNGMKCEVKDVDTDRYIFETGNIRNTMEKFARKRSNGINANSSRAHTILEVIFDDCKLTCIDLCGNERGTSRELKEETNFINKSLFNLSRYLTMGDKYKEKGCQLLNIIRKTSNILMTVIFNDNAVNLSVNHLMLLKDFLKTVVPQAIKIAGAIL